MGSHIQSGARPMRGYKTIQELAFEGIRDRILSGWLRPGQPIRQDGLARELGTSRMPVCEVLRRLTEMGLVRFHPHRGAQVMHLDPTTVEDLFVTRAALEGIGARLAAGRLGRGDLAALRALLEQMDRAATRHAFAAYIRVNDRFHHHLNRRCPLETLTATIDTVRSRCALILRSGFNLPERLAQLQKEHREIFEACRRGDARAAERAMREDILRTAMVLMRCFGGGPTGAQSMILTELLG